MDIKDFPLPANVGEMHALLEQFAYILPEDKYQAIMGVLDKIEAENGIQSAEQGQEVLAEIINMLGFGSQSNKTLFSAFYDRRTSCEKISISQF